jgi:predicted AAA+ superfamily ATPase
MDNTTLTPLAHLRAAREAVNHLILFRGVLADPIGQAFVELLDEALVPGGRRGHVTAAYLHLFALLAEATELGEGPAVTDPWSDHLLRRVLTDDNVFSRKAQRAAAPMGGALVEAARRDLRNLQILNGLTAPVLIEALRELETEEEPERLLAWSDLRPLEDSDPAGLGALMRELASAPDWGALVERLAEHYARAGAGIFARFRAFRWQSAAGGELVGVAWPDPIRLRDLVGYERERQPLLQNTEQFLAGYRANNALLYGDRGTGKSSTVKALLNEYGDRGLRLVEVPRRALHDLPRVMAHLRGRPERFVVFVDDVSFGDGEEGHLDLKALLEGGIEHHPENVVIYVTSNRRHLMREYFTPDRGLIHADGEIRPGDTVQEALSLADRFGLVITFLAPTQERYLEIVRVLAAARGAALDEEDLRRRALQWATRHNGLSGRTARQFVDHLVGELGLAART